MFTAFSLFSVLWLLACAAAVILGVVLIVMLIQTLKKVNQALDIYIKKNNYF
ncbi:hypothetical protein [Paenibacillus tepidiphilus]|uniref:hypothetical protein n=1 Tax=Paenibacillus tepidiphilus TaxID=2608683 RepID=UPI0013A596DA|nr:hypothetical protein [Paenibacillus tepidiphilus]